MRKLAFALFGLASFPTFVVAQASPGEIAPFAKDTVFTVANLQSLGIFRAGSSNQEIKQINFTKTPNVDRVGQWTAALTVSDLSPTYGGTSSAGWTGVVMGQYDTNTTPHRFTPSQAARTANNPFNGDTFGLQIEPRDGLCYTVDRRDGIFFSFRANTGIDFPRPILVRPASGTPRLPVGNYVDPCPVFVDGNIAIVYTDKSRRLIIRDLRLVFNSAGTTVQRAEMLAVREVGTFPGAPMGPTPIIDSEGNMQGCLVGVRKSTTDSDLYMLTGLDPQDRALLVWDTAGQQSHGGFCGGRVFCNNSADASAAWTSRVSWVVGSKTSLGDDATITLGASSSRRPYVATRTTMAVSLQVNNGTIPGVSLGGMNGQFALNGPILIFGTQQHQDVDERSFWKFTVPNDNSLPGILVSFQGLSSINGELPTWTNTATLEFRR